MPTRRTEAMLRGRISDAQAFYFITCCTKSRRPGLTAARLAPLLASTVQSFDTAGDAQTLAFTVMPDHVHWLFRLGERLELGELLAKLKYLSGPSMRDHALAWQRDYYDRRLRCDESVEDYALYTFLNPYRVGLVQPDEPWPWWWTGNGKALRFLNSLNSAGGPPAEWINLPVPASVRHGE